MEFANDPGMLALLSGLPMILFVFWVFFRVFRKAGRSGWWTLLLIVPLVNIVMLWVFAFVRWPAVEAAEAAKTPEVFS